MSGPGVVADSGAPGALARAAVLVEGRSDAAAVEAAATLLGHDLAAAGVEVVPIGGAMAIRRALADHGPGGRGLRLTALLDVGELRHACRALFGGADVPPYADALAHAGVFVCDRDLEDELIRALGPGGVQDVLAEQRDLDRFRAFQHQPAHREEDVHAQLHRFLGTAAGRKVAYGGHLVRALTADGLPQPLRDVVAHALADADEGGVHETGAHQAGVRETGAHQAGVASNDADGNGVDGTAVDGTATDDGTADAYEIQFRWKEEVVYWEGARGLRLDGGWGVDPVVTYVPTERVWREVAPPWAASRREVVLRRLRAHGGHRVEETDHYPGPPGHLGVTR